MPEPLEDRVAQLTERDYCCAQCWGSLMRMPAPERKWFVVCRAYGEEHSGYVTRYYAEKQRSNSVGDLMDVRRSLEEAGVIQNEHKGKSKEQLLKELGF